MTTQNSGRQMAPFGDESQQWKTGDVIGCYVDLDEHSKVRTRNGQEKANVGCGGTRGFQENRG